MATSKDKSALTEAGKKVGKALARSGHTVEETGQKMKKAAEKIVKDATRKAEKSVESAIDKVKKEVSEITRKKPAGASVAKASLFMPEKGMTIEGQIGFLAGDIYEHLCKNGPTPVDKISGFTKKSGNLALMGAALGWLAREAKITFSADGSEVSLL